MNNKIKIVRIAILLTAIVAVLGLSYVFFLEKQEQKSREAIYGEVKQEATLYEKEQEVLVKELKKLKEEKEAEENEEAIKTAEVTEEADVPEATELTFVFDSYDEELYSSIYPKMTEYAWIGMIVFNVDEEGFGALSEDEIQEMLEAGWALSYGGSEPVDMEEWDAKKASLSNALKEDTYVYEWNKEQTEEEAWSVANQTIGEDAETITTFLESLKEGGKQVILSNMGEELGSPVTYQEDVYDTCFQTLWDMQEQGVVRVGSLEDHAKWQEERETARKTAEEEQRRKEEKRTEREQKIQQLEEEIAVLQEKIDATWMKEVNPVKE